MASKATGVLQRGLRVPGKCASSLSRGGNFHPEQRSHSSNKTSLGDLRVEGLYLGMPNHNNKNKIVDGTHWLWLASSKFFPVRESPDGCRQNPKQNF